MSLGVYLSVPFCKAKCSFCNFSSGVFGEEQMPAYVERLATQIRRARGQAFALGAELPDRVDSVYLGGGTPSLLPPGLIERLFAALRHEFEIDVDAEITVECAPGQLAPASLAAFQRAGANRLSFGVQSFIDQECSAVGRRHTGEQCREALREASGAGVERLSLDLIVGLPHQTAASWRSSIDQALASGVEHLSVYMLELDEGSRLGREATLGGVRYGAHALTHEDCVADWYSAGCSWLEDAAIHQYEISNFSRPGAQSRHNRKYWERKPYLGFGMDAHSMLRDGLGGVRWASPDSMAGYLDAVDHDLSPEIDRVGAAEAFEESLFLGLRLLEGVSLTSLNERFGSLASQIGEPVRDCIDAGLLSESAGILKLTAAGRMASNEVFERLLLLPA